MDGTTWIEKNQGRWFSSFCWGWEQIEITFWDYPAFKDQNGETAEQYFMEEDFKFTVYEDPKKRSSPPGK